MKPHSITLVQKVYFSVQFVRVLLLLVQCNKTDETVVPFMYKTFKLDEWHLYINGIVSTVN